MDDTGLNHTSICIVRNRSNDESRARDLRLEILELRKHLAQAEEAAARHATMLREGDHRIKNSLQIVASLINEQARQEGSDTAREALLSAAKRIQSISHIHDALQSEGGADTIDLGAVLKIMCNSLQAMAGSQGPVEVRVQIESVHIPVAMARPVVLAVNELVANALRHAFPDRRAGAVQVRLAQVEGVVSIRISDDGVGLPDGYGAGQGYGTRLVGMMVKQVGGELVVGRAPGATFTIRLPRPFPTKSCPQN